MNEVFTLPCNTASVEANLKVKRVKERERRVTCERGKEVQGHVSVRFIYIAIANSQDHRPPFEDFPPIRSTFVHPDPRFQNSRAPQAHMTKRKIGPPVNIAHNFACSQDKENMAMMR
jgi:hypothetical protein